MCAVASIMTPLVHLWLNALELWVPHGLPQFLSRVVGASHGRMAAAKIAMDQLLFSHMSLASFMVANSLLSGNTWRTVSDKIGRDFHRTIGASYLVWIPAQTLNFYFIPLAYRVLFINSIGFVWNIYLSYMTYR